MILAASCDICYPPFYSKAESVFNEIATKSLIARAREFIQSFLTAYEIPVGPRSDIENVHQRFDIDRELLFNLRRNSLLLENMIAVLDQYIDNVGIQKHSFRHTLKRKTGAVAAVLRIISIQQIFLSYWIPALQAHRKTY
jgi:hypothetical protein